MLVLIARSPHGSISGAGPVQTYTQNEYPRHLTQPKSVPGERDGLSWSARHWDCWLVSKRRRGQSYTYIYILLVIVLYVLLFLFEHVITFFIRLFRIYYIAINVFKLCSYSFLRNYGNRCDHIHTFWQWQWHWYWYWYTFTFLSNYFKPTCTRTSIYTSNTYMYTYISMHIYTYTYAYIHRYTHLHLYVQTHQHTNSHSYTYLYTHFSQDRQM